jgi:hypothetical protein
MSFEFCSHPLVRHKQATTVFVIFIIYNPNVFQLVFFILQVCWTHVLLKHLSEVFFFFGRNYTVIFSALSKSIQSSLQASLFILVIKDAVPRGGSGQHHDSPLKNLSYHAPQRVLQTWLSC